MIVDAYMLYKLVKDSRPINPLRILSSSCIDSTGSENVQLTVAFAKKSATRSTFSWTRRAENLRQTLYTLCLVRVIGLFPIRSLIKNRFGSYDCTEIMFELF